MNEPDLSMVAAPKIASSTTHFASIIAREREIGLSLKNALALESPSYLKALQLGTRAWESPFSKHVEEINRRIAEQSSALGVLASARLHDVFSNAVKDSLGSIDALNLGVSKSLAAHFSPLKGLSGGARALEEARLRANEFASASEALLAASRETLRLESFGALNALRLAAVPTHVFDQLSTLSSASASAWSIAALDPTVTGRIPIHTREGPALNLYAGTRATSLMLAAAEDQEEQAADSALESSTHDVELRLAKFDERLLTLYRGAVSAIQARGPDYIRHFAVSARELLTHVVHALSPESEVQAWTHDPRHYHEGRPTREARLRFILRNIAVSEYERFAEADVQQALGVFKYLNGGTHTLGSTTPPEQLRIFLRRAEATISILLEAAGY